MGYPFIRRRTTRRSVEAPRPALPRAKLVMMVKEPRAGQVKSRLARGIGAAAAASFYRHAVASALARITREREWQMILAVAPDTAASRPVWPRGLARIGQGRGDLGQRMQRVLDTLPAGPVVIVGSDIPGITAAAVRHAFHALGSADVVFGPSHDGGYWLVGARRRGFAPKLFGHVRWSGPHALADTLQNAGRLRVARVRALDDVDNSDDLARLGRARGRRVLPR